MENIKAFIIGCCCLLSYTLSAQIVNIEKKRMGVDSAGWYGSIYASMQVQRTTKSLLDLNFGGHINYFSGKDLVLLVGNIGLIQGEGESFSNSGFLHLRYTHEAADWLEWEYFTQLQYNSLTKIDSRWLTGLGPRLVLMEYDNAQVYFGTLYMFEREILSDPEEQHYDHRLSSYLSFSLRPQETVSFISTTYVQPRIDMWGDYRILNENALELLITERLRFNIQFNMSYDRVPPPAVPSLTYRLLNGLRYTF